MKLLNKMRNTGVALLGGIALLTFSAATIGCSNNEADGLYAADDSKIGLTIKPVDETLDFHNGLLELGSAQSSTIFDVTSTTRWTVEVTDCEGSWCQIVYGEGNSDSAGHIGNGLFTIEAAPNRSSNNRECNVTIYAIESDGSHIPGKSVEIHIEQDRQSIQVDYAGDVIPALGTTNAATQPTVTVKANQPWTASSSHSWVTIIPGEGMDGDSYTGSGEERTVSFKINVEANPGTSTRYAEVTISSPTSAFTPQRLNVTQEGSNETFIVSPSEVQNVSYQGDTVEISVYSPRDSWTASVSLGTEWMSIIGQSSGEASSQPVTIKVKVEANIASSLREGSISIIRPGDIKNDVRIIQNANPEAPNPDGAPRVSMPWIASGWTATYAKIHAYFSSPSVIVERAGVAYQNVDDPEEYKDVLGTIGADNLISVELTGLKPKTRYKVWAFVEYQENGAWVGNSGDVLTFTTPGLDGEPGSGIPGQDDNNPPSPNN